MFYPASNSITCHVYYLLPSETLFVKVGLSGLSHWAVGRIKQNDFYEGVCCRISEASLTVKAPSEPRQENGSRERALGRLLSPALFGVAPSQLGMTGKKRVMGEGGLGCTPNSQHAVTMQCYLQCSKHQ